MATIRQITRQPARPKAADTKTVLQKAITAHRGRSFRQRQESPTTGKLYGIIVLSLINALLANQSIHGSTHAPEQAAPFPLTFSHRILISVPPASCTSSNWC